ncbi:carbon-nitrogen hydrolase family protein [Oerskovia sp. Root22]|uniref:carbon-nitrogen hydrolase family protein n=1 Tax=Oerskovia sp. Root22 TaxID=1736494 RepID=UPI0006F259D8|nr:carbon-nitrogen hydrolase family protein [Oerskovia sp. Root22]KRC34231.1 hydrolase [Oerskovia sp. Root22]
MTQTPHGPVRVTIAQIEVSDDHAANLLVVRSAFAEAGRLHADLLVLPEYASGFDPRGVGIEHAEPLDGPFVTTLQRWASETGVAVIAGTTIPGSGAPQGGSDEQGGGPTSRGSTSSDGAASEEGSGGAPVSTPVAAAPDRPTRAVNAVVAIDAHGRLSGIYRKVHLYDAFGHRESDRLEPGPADAPPTVLTVGGLTFGVMTCYDLRFPEAARRLVDAGADVLVVPAAWAAGDLKADHWRTLARARAIENTSVVLAVGQAGKGVTGRSLLVGPDGQVGLELDERAGLRTADIDPEALAGVRRTNPSLANRRYAVVPVPGPATQPYEPDPTR